jgi:two-component system, LytTR family, sensor kinase
LYYYEKGYDAYQETQLDKAIKLLNQAVVLHSRVKYTIGIADDWNYIGIVNISTGDYSSSAESLLTAKKYYILAKNNIGVQNTLYNLSQVYLKLDDFTNAANSLIEALKFAEKEKDKNGMCDIYDQLGTIYIMQNEIDLAKSYFLKSLALKKESNYTTSLATSYRSLGVVSFKKKQYKDGIDYFKKAYDVATNKLQTKAIHTSKGVILFEMGDYSESEKCLKEALIENESANAKGIIYPLLSQIYYKRGNLKDAEKFGLLGFELTKKNKYIDKQFEAANSLYLTYKQAKQIEKSFQFLEISTSLKDSINKKTNRSAMLKADFKYETEKKEATLKTLSQKNKISELESKRKTSFLLILGVMFLAIGTTAVVLFSRFKVKKQNEILAINLAETQKMLAAEKKVTESELKALRSQMNPHFIFNALNTIQQQFMYGDKMLANQNMNNFSYLTRQILEASGKKKITLDNEIEILTKYLDLEKMRFTKDFEYTVTFDKDIDLQFHTVPPMLIQPFAENSVKHGLLHRNGLKKLDIHFDLDDSEDFMVCTITDNGIGRDASAIIKSKNNVTHNSFSTEAINQRLELLNENLQLKDLVVYEDVLNENNEVFGTKVMVKIPLV